MALACGFGGAAQAAPFSAGIDEPALYQTFSCDVYADCGASPDWNGRGLTARRTPWEQLDAPYGRLLESLQNDNYMAPALNPPAGRAYSQQTPFAAYLAGIGVTPVPEAPVSIMLLVGLGLLLLSGHEAKYEKFSL
ncbi:hypothetical protein [Janthinobacterium agaricidamnosum]|uniref:Uncharacterized protein n=1 Tax=Janthinobacterium agaricidamnosum NBRC 102515 = DSM 9628 TaxID=1349767 RepID=W0V2A8_9BURK|nr:hypothetical protein [Janthinobacterium agaricidamnosum]CDG81468.1 hypothetical protein GJA_809 [Janthinobacterium agaricidamnosum NBRC 102515 = DSM 9628]